MLVKIINNVLYTIIVLAVLRAATMAAAGIWMMIKDIAAGANRKLVLARNR
jgi:hypothetical protein